MWYRYPCRRVYLHLSSNVCCMSGTPTALRYTIWIGDGRYIFSVGVPLNVKYQSLGCAVLILLKFRNLPPTENNRKPQTKHTKPVVFWNLSLYLNLHLYLTVLMSTWQDLTCISMWISIFDGARHVLNKCRQERKAKIKLKLMPTFLKVYSAINSGDNYKDVTCQLLH